jgi:hypothetical protein
MTTRNMLDAARIGRQTANGPEAQEKRANTQRKNAIAQHAWKRSDQPAWLTEKLYSEKVQPIVEQMSASVIARKLSVSRWYAGRIRARLSPRPISQPLAERSRQHRRMDQDSSCQPAPKPDSHTASWNWCSHHTRQALARTMGCPALHPKAFRNSSKLLIEPLTRNSPGECGSVCTCRRSTSGV